MKTGSGEFNNALTRVLAFLVTALLIAIMGGQIYQYFNDSHDTQEAQLCTINEDISFEGIIVRDESVITYDRLSEVTAGGGVISYLYSDSGKVSEGSVIAQVFDSEEDAGIQTRLAQIEEEIALLERAQNPGTTDYVQPESISSKIDDYYKQMISDVDSGKLDGFSSVREDLTLVMNIYNIISGINGDYNARIAELQSEYESLSAQTSGYNDEIVSPATGYFVSGCDGYENVLTKESALELSQSDIEKITEDLSASPDGAENSIGKIFEEYSCYIAGVIEDDPRIAEGVSLELMLDSSDSVYDVDVISVKEADEEGKIVAVLSCDRLDESLVSQRAQSMQLIFDEYTGLKVPRSAIRFQGEQKGVYVILGEDITFKKLDVIYEGSDFVISKLSSDDDYLLLYDQILLEVVSENDVQDDDGGGSDES